MGFSRRKKSNRQINGTTMIVPGIDSVQFGGIKIDNRNITKFRTGVAPTPTDPTIDRENPFIPQPPTPTPSSSIPTTPTPTPTPSVTITSTPTVTPTPTITPTPSTSQVVWSHQLRYSPDDYSSGCTSSAGTYYTAANAIYNQILYTNVGLTNIAPTGYYTTDTQPCPDSYGYWGYFVNAFGTATVSILYNPCPEYYFFGKYDPVSTSGLCSASNTFLITPDDFTSPQIGDTYYTDTSNCVFAPDGYYSWCDCVTYTYDYFVISGGTGQISFVQSCPTPTPTPTVTQTPSITPTVTVTPTPSVTTTVTPSATPANLLLLDNYSGATAGYSTRKLKSSATLSLRVRRSSDNSEQDIGFDGNNLDLTSLTSFIGSDDAFVTRWYDQSGNNYEFAQLSASLQPRIALSGTVDTANGIPSIYFGEATIKYMEVFLADEPPFDFTDTFSLYMALKPANQSGAQVAFGKGTGLFGQNGYYVVFDPSIAIGNCVFNNSDVSPTNFSVITSGNTSLGCYGWNFSSGNGNGSFNGITNNTYTGMISCKLNNSLPIIGVYQTFASATDFDGWFSEMIIFPSDQTSNKSGIETNIMNYFGI